MLFEIKFVPNETVWEDNFSCWLDIGHLFAATNWQMLRPFFCRLSAHKQENVANVQNGNQNTLLRKKRSQY